MVVIRLARHGRKKKAFYRVVVIDRRKARNGLFIEQIGYHDPFQLKNTSINYERILYWKSVGAQMSKTVISLVKKISMNN